MGAITTVTSSLTLWPFIKANQFCALLSFEATRFRGLSAASAALPRPIRSSDRTVTAGHSERPGTRYWYP
eukprot:766811-Hanusia_phi.AAC.1